ncbi:hypothetical protein AMAG_17695 [Allomyces macrogynus ATCC 38327]|uniref:Uncharacterized protein n=1 Tax=Allomyces macrogynus (strain ATCC 38327) TaxID=578462 RepID=A0A0L0RXC5_ALLM3|nr:hypothetical protein AMAG_17695 [Allomyces macrogynus ATCC 38327]|eukprot:KNE54716.1 hypothetical protein AMAG_17695 [Allomyces macrogynus ATCC 38327]
MNHAAQPARRLASPPTSDPVAHRLRGVLRRGRPAIARWIGLPAMNGRARQLLIRVSHRTSLRSAARSARLLRHGCPRPAPRSQRPLSLVPARPLPLLALHLQPPSRRPSSPPTRSPCPRTLLLPLAAPPHSCTPYRAVLSDVDA